MGGRLAENVVHFARVLRAAGIPVGIDKISDAIRMLPVTGLERRDDCRVTLSAIFLTRHEQQALFDEAFDRFWRDPAFEERAQALRLPEVRGRLAKPALNPGRVREAMTSFGARVSQGAGAQDEVTVDATLTFSAAEQLKAMDFERMTGDEWSAARRLVASLDLPVPLVRTRRYRPRDRGDAIDLGATLRRMARDGGEWTRIVRRARIDRPPPLVALCDISGSMQRYTRMFLHFLHALTRERQRVSTLVFGTRLTNITRPLRDRDVDEALARAGALVPDWAGGTRIGACLREFNLRWARRLLGQNACVLIVSDGLDRDDAEGLADEMARLKRSCRRLVWLNPLLRYEGFEPRASGIEAMLPHVDEFLPVHNIASLEDLAARLSAARQTNGTDRPTTPER